MFITKLDFLEIFIKLIPIFDPQFDIFDKFYLEFSIL